MLSADGGDSNNSRIVNSGQRESPGTSSSADSVLLLTIKLHQVRRRDPVGFALIRSRVQFLGDGEDSESARGDAPRASHVHVDTSAGKAGNEGYDKLDVRNERSDTIRHRKNGSYVTLLFSHGGCSECAELVSRIIDRTRRHVYLHPLNLECQVKDGSWRWLANATSASLRLIFQIFMRIATTPTRVACDYRAVADDFTVS